MEAPFPELAGTGLVPVPQVGSVAGVTEPLEDRWTTRLHLRRITADDVPAIAAIESDPRTCAHQPSGPPSLEEATETARSFVAQWGADGVGYWAVELRGALIGVAGLRFMNYALRDCWNLAYRFSPDFWGLGYATEAVAEAMQVAFTHTPRLPVVARVRPDNGPALKLAEKAGLERHPALDRDGFLVFVSHW